MISQGVNVITASRSIGGDGLNTYGSMSQWLDHIAYNHDIHFVKSAGNEGTDGVTSWGMAYNILTVGNIDDRRTTSYSDDIIRDSSSRYSGNGLAFKPDICAPGSSTPIASSRTSYSNVEIVDFNPTTTGTYRIVVKNYKSYGTTYYGLVWR